MSSSPRSSTSTEYQSPSYILEVCACCDGSGFHSAGLCPACEGQARVKVLYPSSECPQCGGSGFEGAQPVYYAQLCTGCRGTGWKLG